MKNYRNTKIKKIMKCWWTQQCPPKRDDGVFSHYSNTEFGIHTIYNSTLARCLSQLHVHNNKKYLICSKFFDCIFIPFNWGNVSFTLMHFFEKPARFTLHSSKTIAILERISNFFYSYFFSHNNWFNFFFIIFLGHIEYLNSNSLELHQNWFKLCIIFLGRIPPLYFFPLIASKLDHKHFFFLTSCFFHSHPQERRNFFLKVHQFHKK